MVHCLARTGLDYFTPFPFAGWPNAFAQSFFPVLTITPAAFGDAGRNIVVAPGYRDFDFSLLKNTKIGENINVQFRTEFFNIFNHPSFAIPSNIRAAANFGSLFQTPDAAQSNVGLGSGGPRLVQFALKLSF
jgi:hypothetical protein